ncbi:PREDICTED: uncharacterized protein LOC105361730 [Ceratosolen solmsi marchali]|uniref:Uncharacterized protein LOC105361730 n=1 Tax=Ceratosolen solmsi marchali TaxID=326594 RepID=A0AAJ6YFT4_9HYME|nr:PREDICTED: uncharacterized protein LOC105361730 [Ceratosolen solmsi marchali]
MSLRVYTFKSVYVSVMLSVLCCCITTEIRMKMSIKEFVVALKGYACNHFRDSTKLQLAGYADNQQHEIMSVYGSRIIREQKRARLNSDAEGGVFECEVGVSKADHNVEAKNGVSSTKGQFVASSRFERQQKIIIAASVLKIKNRSIIPTIDIFNCKDKPTM